MAGPTKKELSEQQALSENIHTVLVNINKRLVDQLKVQELINQSAKKQVLNMASVNQNVSQALKAGGVTLSGAAIASSNLNSSLLATPGAASSAGTSIAAAGTQMATAFDKGADAWDNVTKMLHQLVPRSLMLQLNSLQQVFGGLSGPSGPFVKSSNAVGKFRSEVVSAYDSMLEIEGPFHSSFGMVPQRALGNLTKIMESYRNLIMGNGGLVDGLRVARSDTTNLAMEMRSYGKAMNLSAEATAAIVSRQISRTGKAGSQMLKEAAVYSKRLAAITGDSAKMIGQNIAKIIDDTKNFGNVSVREAARISATLREVGIRYEDLGGMVSKFHDFKGAADSVSKLTTVFGVNINAMEMMKLSYKDPEMMMRKMRTAFLDAGISARNLRLDQKQLIAESLNFKDIQSVERYLDPTATVTSFEELRKGTDKSVGGMEESLNYLKDEIIDLQSLTEYSSTKMTAFMGEKLRQPFAKTAISMEQNSAKIAAAFEGMLPKNIAKAVGFFGEGITKLIDLDESKIKMLQDGLGGILKDMVTYIKEIEKSNLGQSLSKSLGPGVAKEWNSMGSSAEQMAQKVTLAIAKMSEDIIAQLKKMKVIRASKSVWDKMGDNMAEASQKGGKAMVNNTRQATRGQNALYEAQVKDKAKTDKKLEKLEGAHAARGKKVVMDMQKFEKFQDHRRHKAQIKKGLEGLNQSKNLQKVSDQVAKDISEIKIKREEALTNKIQKIKQEQVKKEVKLEKKKGVQLRKWSAFSSKAQASQNKAYIDRVWKMQKATDSVFSNMSKSAKKEFGKITDISSKELDKQLKTTGSTYNKIAKAIGRSNIRFDELTDTQKDHYSQMFKLGKNSEKELRMIWESKAATGSQRQGKMQEYLVNMLNRYKKEGKTADSFGSVVLDRFKSQYGLSKSMLSYALKEGGDVRGVVAKGLAEAKQERDAKLAKQKETKGPGEPGSDKGSKRSSAGASSGAIARNTKNTNSKLDVLVTEVRNLTKAINNKDFTAKGDINLDGQTLVDYIIKNPRGSSNSRKVEVGNT